MQVATLFRETATLLGASMETQEASGVDPQAFKFRSAFLDGAMKLESHDDGYETSGDLELRSQRDSQKCLSHIQNAGALNMKCEPPEDPYSFVDDDPTPTPQARAPPVIMQPVPKKRGRKKKNLLDGGLENTENLLNGDALVKKKIKEEKFMPMFKERKKHDRFNGMPEEEVSKRTLPDHLALNLDIVIIGINPGLFAAYKGHHYAGPGNHFWKCLYLSGLTPEPMTADDDYKLLQVGIGFTNMVARATKGSADLTRKEIKEGSQILLEKLQKFKPKIAVFNGKLIFEVFSGKKDFSFGRQPDFVDGTNTYMWVMPSSSARCAQLPRAADKVPFYAALKKFRDYLNGMITDLDETEVVFSDSKLKNYFEPELKEEPKEEHPFMAYGRIPNNGELTDLSNSVTKKDDQPPAKKKRGRPKKIKTDNVETKKVGQEVPKKEHDSNCGEMPKKKRGRPKKIKSDDVLGPSSGMADHTNSSAGLSNCFSPPIQSPTSFAQQGFAPPYGGQAAHAYAQSAQPSPSEPPHGYHHSPVPQPHYSQSPQPPSQPFTHSDLSSEISAAISSEHNLGSPSPTSPSLGPPDFEPPSSMPEDATEEHGGGSKDEGNPGDQSSQNPNECRFSSPAPSGDAPNLSYQNFGNFQSGAEGHSVMGYSHGAAPDYNPKRTLAQDVSSKSLSGLESLVDQIPSIAEGEATHNAVVGSSNGDEQFESNHAPTSQFSDEGAYMSGYSNSQQYSGSNSNNSSNYSPHFTSSSTNYSVSTSNSYNLHHSSASMNFSVTSLANSSASGGEIGGQVSSSFSVSSLASNYTSMNPGLMAPAHPMAGHMVSSPNGPMGGGMFAGGMGGGIMDRTCGMGSSMGALGSPVGLAGPMASTLPYPYGQYSHGAASYPGAAGGGFQYAPAHNLHVPSPNYPYPSPYSAANYPQASYLPNHVLDRIKQDRMDIGFGGF